MSWGIASTELMQTLWQLSFAASACGLRPSNLGSRSRSWITHIRVGNSLLGATPALLAKGIPDDLAQHRVTISSGQKKAATVTLPFGDGA